MPSTVFHCSHRNTDAVTVPTAPESRQSHPTQHAHTRPDNADLRPPTPLQSPKHLADNTEAKNTEILKSIDLEGTTQEDAHPAQPGKAASATGAQVQRNPYPSPKKKPKEGDNRPQPRARGNKSESHSTTKHTGHYRQ